MRIFISSTFRDLGAERQAAQDTLRRSELVPWGMELFVSQPSEPLDVCLEQVQLSDAVVLNHRFQSRVTDSRKPWTDLHPSGIRTRSATRQEGICIF